MKTRLVIAAAIGALISGVLLALEPMTGFALLSWEFPGITAAYLFWGMLGSSVAMGLAIAWLVNAIMYDVAAFAVLTLSNRLIQVLRK